MTEITPTPDQRKAMETLESDVFVAAGAGSGKTEVITGRFVYAVATGFARVDQILTITFTRKAAAEMMRRIRDDLRNGRILIDGPADQGQLSRMTEAYRDIERAQISTIDSFYTSLLRANALAAGIDPEFKPVDEAQSSLLREEVFDLCLRRVVEEGGREATDFITAYDPDLSGELFQTISRAYDVLRSQGKPVTLPEPQMTELRPIEKALSDAIDEARSAFGALDKPPTRTQLETMEKLVPIEAGLTAADPVERAGLADPEIKAGNCGVLKGPFQQVEKARKEFVLAIRSALAKRMLGIFRRLLVLFDQEYKLEKQRRGVLDFSDLCVITRDLLLENEDIRRRIASSFKMIMVDEFQDTNPLQHEIIKLISDDNLFVVGDENQAIYGFRDAEVALFKQQKEAARQNERLIELTDNFRSQSDILRFVDYIFKRDEMLVPGYLQLEPRAKAEPDEEFRVEVILIDCCRDSTKEGLEKVGVDVTRLAEAQRIAERLKELFDSGEYAPGDVAILLRNRTDAETYRDALTRLGIVNYFAVGSNYFGKLELSDVLNMFRLVVNPCNDLALIAVLRSPMGGLSDDALYWLRNFKDEGEDVYAGCIWNVVEDRDVIDKLGERDRVRLADFVTRLKAVRQAAGRVSLESLARMVVDFDDYAAGVAAGAEGKQNLANLMKLLDLAADFESSWGDDVVEFTKFLEHQKNIKVREVEAPTEREGVQAVCMMTMHAAKGLEFPLVVLPNLGGGQGGNHSSVLMLDRSGGDRIGLRYVANDNASASGPAFDYDELKAEKTAREAQELKRLGYVAMTRARRHLMLVGSAPADKPPNLAKKTSLPFDWIRCYLGLRWERDEKLGSVDRLDDVNGIRVGLRIGTDPRSDAQRYLKAGEDRAEHLSVALNEEINRMPGAAAYVPQVVSPTALDKYQVCPRRFYLENVLRAGDLFESQGTGKPVTSGGTLSPMEMGSLVHKVLELDLAELETQPATAALLDQRAAGIFGADIRLASADHEEATRLIDNFRHSPVAATLFQAAGTGELQRELSFSTLVGASIIMGQIDALCHLGSGETGSGKSGMLVVDYKTGKPGENRTAVKAAESYRLQMASYALAAARMHPGDVRVVLTYLGGDTAEEVIAEYKASDIVALGEELQSVIDSMGGGDFPSLEDADGHYCTWCVGGNNGAGLCL